MRSLAVPLHPLQQFVPRATQGEAQPGHHVDAGLLLARLQGLQVAVGDVGLLGERFLGHALLHAQAHEAASEQNMSGSCSHPPSMTGRPGRACDL